MTSFLRSTVFQELLPLPLLITPLTSEDQFFLYSLLQPLMVVYDFGLVSHLQRGLVILLQQGYFAVRKYFPNLSRCEVCHSLANYFFALFELFIDR